MKNSPKNSPKYLPEEEWYAGPNCNGYKKGTVLRILRVSGEGKQKKLTVTDCNHNVSEVSFKKLWKRCN